MGWEIFGKICAGLIAMWVVLVCFVAINQVGGDSQAVFKSVMEEARRSEEQLKLQRLEHAVRELERRQQSFSQSG